MNLNDHLTFGATGAGSTPPSSPSTRSTQSPQSPTPRTFRLKRLSLAGDVGLSTSGNLEEDMRDAMQDSPLLTSPKKAAFPTNGGSPTKSSSHTPSLMSQEPGLGDINGTSPEAPLPTNPPLRHQPISRLSFESSAPYLIRGTKPRPRPSSLIIRPNSTPLLPSFDSSSTPTSTSTSTSISIRSRTPQVKRARRRSSERQLSFNGIGSGSGNGVIKEGEEVELDSNSNTIRNEWLKRRSLAAAGLPGLGTANGVRGMSPRRGQGVTLVEQNAGLLSRIAQKEARIQEMRADLAREEDELTGLKKEWESIINRSAIISTTTPSIATTSHTAFSPNTNNSSHPPSHTSPHPHLISPSTHPNPNLHTLPNASDLPPSLLAANTALEAGQRFWGNLMGSIQTLAVGSEADDGYDSLGKGINGGGIGTVHGNGNGMHGRGVYDGEGEEGDEGRNSVSALDGDRDGERRSRKRQMRPLSLIAGLGATERYTGRGSLEGGSREPPDGRERRMSSTSTSNGHHENFHSRPSIRKERTASMISSSSSTISSRSFVSGVSAHGSTTSSRGKMIGFEGLLDGVAVGQDGGGGGGWGDVMSNKQLQAGSKKATAFLSGTLSETYNLISQALPTPNLSSLTSPPLSQRSWEGGSTVSEGDENGAAESERERTIRIKRKPLTGGGGQWQDGRRSMTSG